MRLVVGFIVLALALVIVIAAVKGTQGKVWEAIFGGGHTATTTAATTPAASSATTPAAQSPSDQLASSPQYDAAMSTAQGAYTLAA